MSNKRLRDTERVVHLICGLMLLIFVYAPWNDMTLLTYAVQWLVFPVLVGSGFAMWLLPRARRWLAAHRGIDSRRT